MSIRNDTAALRNQVLQKDYCTGRKLCVSLLLVIDQYFQTKVSVAITIRCKKSAWKNESVPVNTWLLGLTSKLYTQHKLMVFELNGCRQKELIIPLVTRNFYQHLWHEKQDWNATIKQQYVSHYWNQRSFRTIAKIKKKVFINLRISS